MAKSTIITLSCEDRPGIVAGLTTELFEAGANIAESAQFWDRDSGRFFLRIAADFEADVERESLERQLSPLADRFGMHLKIRDAARRPKIVVMVSAFDHALLHLLYQIRVGWLDAEVVAIVSNRENSRETAEAAGIPFHHWPVTKETKAEQEEKLLKLVRETDCDLVVLARYMQILSDNLSRRLSGKVINIHHSFLPSFKGAKPYHQAHQRGVKLIGATAHYVTADLDEGPIIEQETERVSHALSADDLVAVGRDIEARVLARAVKLHLEGRVMLNGTRTVVFG
ncbi:formyltetrahydrofolate deformylase [Jiella avicenniae]|uniref:Formyltetrahydrofolate deformylase n=1 Tax=Jiella avicenniae TaxID=2907202 RepID=A0A9X1P418_9HYPH|nr:formyltetrahydrofolate deformylase [Jiella avicenniae]MCE7029359.1 formyltetrahydrofolate deformylase [Jiella avicenniae]